MNIRYIHKSTEGVTQMANIMWDDEKWPMKQGSHPPEHPCLQQSDAFAEFKRRGYWANPFPEGDGITLDTLNDQSREDVIRDVEECFGWTVTNK